MDTQPAVVFPQTQIGTDPATVREYARVAEAAGYGHLLAPNHVLAGDPETEADSDHSNPFHRRHEADAPTLEVGEEADTR